MTSLRPYHTSTYPCLTLPFISQHSPLTFSHCLYQSSQHKLLPAYLSSVSTPLAYSFHLHIPTPSRYLNYSPTINLHSPFLLLTPSGHILPLNTSPYRLILSPVLYIESTKECTCMRACHTTKSAPAPLAQQGDQDGYPQGHKASRWKALTKGKPFPVRHPATNVPLPDKQATKATVGLGRAVTLPLKRKGASRPDHGADPLQDH